MKICVFGMGYVGCVSAACLARSGHDVIGVEVREEKLAIIREGKSPIVEPGMAELISEQVAAGRLSVTSDVEEAVSRSEISLVCVGTPSQRNGSLDLSYVTTVCEEIGAALARREGHHVIVIRSTMLPGSAYQTVLPALERSSGRKPGEHYSVAINPEFLREGSALRDYLEPPFTLVGSDDLRARITLKSLYKDINAPLLKVGVREAEMVKYACNCFHGLKVAFANEVGNLCKAANIDSHVVMDVFCQDDKLNLSPYYLRPGFAFGGSCLPKDLRALNYKARQMDVKMPVLQSILPSNEHQIDVAFERLENLETRQVSMLGLSFKEGTDDLRESPMVTLAERLIGRGYKLQIFDREVELARLVGANKSYIDSEIPHLSALLNSSLENTVIHGDAIVVCKQSKEYASCLNSLAGDRHIIDLIRLADVNVDLPGYDGLSW